MLSRFALIYFVLVIRSNPHFGLGDFEKNKKLKFIYIGLFKHVFIFLMKHVYISLYKNNIKNREE